MGGFFAMHADHVTREADAQIDFWRSSQRNTSEALKPDQAVLKIADEAIRIRVELTAIRRALQKICGQLASLTLLPTDNWRNDLGHHH
jgi:hypothetical protein